MRATEFITSNMGNQLLPINEVAMNPTAYAKSIEIGESSGVLVGFEFEVCVTQAVIKSYHEANRAEELAAAQAQPQLPITTQRVGNIIKQHPSIAWNNGQFEDMMKFDDNFTPNENSKYPSLTIAKKAILDKRIETSKEILSQLPADLLSGFRRLSRAKIQRRIRTGNSYGTELSPEEKELEIMSDIAGRYRQYFRSDLNQFYTSRGLESSGSSWHRLETRASNYDSDEAVANRALDQLVEKLSNMQDQVGVGEVLRTMFTDLSTHNTVYSVMENINDFFTYDPQKVYNDYNLINIDPDVPDVLRPNSGRRLPSGYSGAVSILEPALKKTMSSDVIVYGRYHEDTKNMTSWYIEPDGSLRPNGFDGAAEIVGPPEPPKAALTSLRKFFTMASELKLYTSKRNNTGLHINVSIPKDLDVLKLAVMLGDEYILKKFDRENNNYAKSVMNYLQMPRTSADQRVASTVTSDVKTIYGSTESKINLDLLKEIAERISGDHFSSINWTGKYISFRHAGGDYLKDYNEILNVVGRFVRSIVIASDPTAYRNEYLKAVVKLVNQRQPVEEIDNSRYINEIKQNGLVIKIIDLYLKKDRFNNPSISDFETVLSREHKILPGVNCSVTTSSEAAQQKLITKSSSDGNARALMSDQQKSPIQQFAHCEIIPDTIGRSHHERRGEYRGVQVQHTSGVGIPVGYRYVSIIVVPATDPRAIKFIRALRTAQPRY